MALTKQQRDRLPSTLARSPEKAQATYIHTLESAEKTHGDGEAAHRIALDSLEHSFEKVGDPGSPKREKGPSDAQAARSRPCRPRGSTRYDRRRSRQLRQQGQPHRRRHAARHQRRSKMTQAELVKAIDKANRSTSPALVAKGPSCGGRTGSPELLIDLQPGVVALTSPFVPRGDPAGRGEVTAGHHDGAGSQLRAGARRRCSPAAGARAAGAMGVGDPCRGAAAAPGWSSQARVGIVRRRPERGMTMDELRRAFPGYLTSRSAG